MKAYNKENIPLAKTLRKNMTPWERKLWYEFLKNYPLRFQRQKAIGNYINHGISWNTARNHAAWKLYLRDLSGEIPAYAAPARQTDYTNLPPAYTFTGDREPFYCETLTFIENLQNAGVKAHVDVYPTGFHAFDMLMPFRKISRQAVAAFEKQFLCAAEHYFAPQKD